jgi:chromate reductase, NAD(P)H dehydrogenase (quinone)
MNVLAISGSLRAGSNSTALLRALREEAPEGIDVVLWNGLKEIPPYDHDDDGVPALPAVAALRDAVGEADAVFFATPEYNSSIPGALKNALDWASRPLATNAFRNKPVAVIGSSAGAFGGVWAAAELRKVLAAERRRVLAAVGAHATEVELAVGHAGEKFREDGSLIDGDVRQALREALETLAAEAAPVEVAA